MTDAKEFIPLEVTECENCGTQIPNWVKRCSHCDKLIEHTEDQNNE